MNTKITYNYESDFKSIKNLLMAMRYDPVINKKIIKMLKMESYSRCLVLNNWLEQLRNNNAPKKLIRTLSILFDDIIAEKIYELLKKSKANNQDK